MKDRIAYYDFLRGVAIIGVVAIHSSGIGLNDESNSISFWSTVIWRQMINFAVPLFLALSGFFIGGKNISTKQEYFLFLKSKLPRVLIPYSLWSLLYLSSDFYHNVPLKGIIVKILTFQTSMPFYFILLIIQYYLLLPFFQKIISKKGLFFSAVISILSCFIFFFIRYYTKINLPFFLYAGLFPTWMIFFMLGLYIRKHNINIAVRRLNFFILAFFLLALLETFIIFRNFHKIEDAVTAIKFSIFFFSFFLILRFFNNKPEFLSKKLKPIIFIGEVSFGIFLSHMFLLKLVATVLNKTIFIFMTNVLIYQFLLVVFTVMFSLLMIILLRKINSKVAITYFGC